MFKKDLEKYIVTKYKDDLVYMLYHWEYLMKDIPEMKVFMNQLNEEKIDIAIN